MRHFKLFGSSRGGITIFQCLIFTALLMLGGVIIDAARIITAQSRVQAVLNTAARSSLAAYDKDIVGEYGIFALNTESGTLSAGNTADDIFKDYIERNLGKTDEKYSLISYKLDCEKSKLSGMGSLIAANSDSFREQILKYMKYKGPINITGNVLDKLKASGIFKKADFASEEKKARSSWSSVRKNVEEVNSSIKPLNDCIRQTNTYEGREYIDALKNMKLKLSEVNEKALLIEEAYKKYGQTRENADNLAKEANKDPTINQEGVHIQLGGESLNNSVEESKNIINVLKVNNSELEAQISKIEPLQDILDDLIRKKAELEDANSNLDKKIKSLSENVDIDEISKLKSEIEENNNSISQLQTEINNLRSTIRNYRDNLSVTEINEMSVPQDTVDTREKPVGKVDWSDLVNLKSLLENYLKNKVIMNEWLITPDEFQQAKDNEQVEYQEILLRNVENKKVADSEADAEAAEMDSDGAISFLKSLYSDVITFFSDGGQASIEKLYVVEYIMDKFTYHTAQTERNHYFEKGEVEYILWGGTNQNSNIAKTVTSISVIRLAINTIDYFATSKVPHPVLRLVYSVGRGLIQSCIDTYDLYNGKVISICPSLKGKGISFSMNYEDHIRLFLLLQSVKNESGQLNNIRQLIQVNISQNESRENFRLRNYETKVAVKATVKINLLFIPLLQLDKMGVKNFDGGYYIITKEAYMGY